MPKFLEDKPTNEDSLGETHKKLTDTLDKIIDNLTKNGLVKNIIGLFGDWGSGKSSVIKMLEDKKNKNDKENKYTILEFDYWSHKDEFLKRAFLIELTKKLGYEKKYLGDIGFTKEGYKEINTIDYLSKKNLVKTLNVKPENNFNGIGFWGALILFLILLKILGLDIIKLFLNWINPFLNLKILTWFESFYFQYLDIIYILLFILLGGIFIKGFYPNFIIENKNNYSDEKGNKNNENNSNKKGFKALIDYILFKKINYTETLTSSENEDFSNYDYQEYFKIIIKKYLEENNDKKLIIVLDNLDRVDDNIVLNSISLIQTTLEGIKDKKDKNIFNNLIFILPIDKDRLKKVFEKLLKEGENDENFTEGFIDKTFSVIVDIPSLDQADWRTYFKTKLEYAFEEEKKIIEELNIGLLISKFYKSVKEESKKSITPREIINFLNELVSSYLYWGEKIKLLHQGIYILYKRYSQKELKDIIKIRNIDKSLDYKLNFIEGYDNREIFEDILKQYFKSSEIYNIIYLDKFIEDLKEGNYEENNKILEIIKNEDKKDGLIDKVFQEIESNISNLNELGKIALSIYNINGKKLEEFKNRLINLIENKLNENETISDKKSAEGILKLLKEKGGNKVIENFLPKNLIEAVILSNKPKKDE